jgi:hypothetical protein
MIIVVNIILGVLRDSANGKKSRLLIPVRVDDSSDFDLKRSGPRRIVIIDPLNPDLTVLNGENNFVGSRVDDNFIAKPLVII